MAMSREDAEEWLLTYRELHDNFKSTMIGRTQNDTGYTLKDPRTGEYIPRKKFNKYILPNYAFDILLKASIMNVSISWFYLMALSMKMISTQIINKKYGGISYG